MSKKTISGRELCHGAPEENLSPGESILIEKRGGKVFELRRMDSEKKSILDELDRILREIPDEGPPFKHNLSETFIEDRE